jgi:3D (Asp-Asp-Asp) domain-containing protein
MKKIKISEDLVPLSSRQRMVLSLIIACIFQFVFFFTPVLAAEAVAQDQGAIKMGPTSKSQADPVVAVLIEQAQAKTETSALKASSTLATVAEETPASETTPQVKVVRTSTHTMTAYNSDPAQTDSTPCITANGFDVCAHGEEDTIAANFLKFGTKVRIPELYGDRIFVVRDRMNKRYSDRVDIWMKEKTDARKFGVKVAKIEVVEVIE